MATRTSFTGEAAPCGRVVDGTRYSDHDDAGMTLVHLHYGCGCQDFRDDFHDGEHAPSGNPPQRQGAG